VGERSRVQGMGHPNQVMGPRDRRDQLKSQDLVTMHHLLKDQIITLHLLKGQVIMPLRHKDQVIMVHLLKDQVTMDSKNLIMEVADLMPVLVPLKTPDPTTTMDNLNQHPNPNNSLGPVVCSKCCLPPI